MKIELTRNPDPGDAKTISQGLIDFNHTMVQDLEHPDKTVNFSIFVRNEGGDVEAGLRASCYWNVLEIELIWVSKNMRQQGVGANMLKQAEDYAIQHGFAQAIVSTTDWQALPFDEKMGYKVASTIKDHPKGHDCYFMSKQLPDSIAE